jgi:hypothetical protein
MERLGQAVIRAYDLGLLARAPPSGGAMAGWAGQLGPDRLGLRPVSLFTRSLGTPYVGPFHRLTVNRGQMPFGAVWRSLLTISTIVCRWCNTLVLPWYGAGVVLVWFGPVSQLVETG